MKEKICVEIAGIKLNILSEDGRTYVEDVAKTVDEEIKDILKNKKGCSLIEAALFMAMTYSSQGGEDSMKVRNLETQIALYQANLNRMRKENEELRTQLSSNGAQN